MNISTLRKPGLLAGVAFGMSLLLCAPEVSAATKKTWFMDNGIVYEVAGNKVKTPNLHPARKSDTPIPENVPDYDPDTYNYTGDIVLPETVTYKDVTYTLTDISTAFKGMEITSLSMPETITKLSNGAFQNCAKLTTIKLSSAITAYPTSLFSGCESLTEFSISGNITALSSSMFNGCNSLTKLTFEESDKPIAFNLIHITGGPDKNLKEVYAYRQLTDDGTMANKPFRGCKSLEKMVLGKNFTAISASYFEGASALANLEIQGELTEIGTAALAGTPIAEFTMPEAVTVVPANLFTGCKNLKKVTLASGTTGIEPMAFQNSGVSEIAFPASLTYVGDMAFQNTALAGKIELPAALTRIGSQAFAANSGITEVVIPASVKNIGNGAFMRDENLAKFTVDAASEYFAADATGSYVTDKAGATLVMFAPKASLTAISLPEVTAVAAYACYGATGLESIDLPACRQYGDYSFLGSGIKQFAPKGIIGRYVAQDCHNLTDLVLDNLEIPIGIAAGCEKLENVTLPARITVVKQDAFKGTTSLKSVNLGSILAIIESGAFDNTGIEKLYVGATYPAIMPDNLFNESHAGITAYVPVSLVDAYRNAQGWNVLKIEGDANIAVGGADMGMPAGLYYAGEDGNLHCVYADGESDSYDIGGAPHTFQLLEYNNRIYGASAGKQFVYSSTGATDGDGKLFYITKIEGEILQATLLDNAGGNAYKDPFGLYLYDETLYVNDRNVCIRKIPANAISLPQNFPSWMENNWMAFYGTSWAYGCIKAGFAVSTAADGKEPLYWVGMKYNGNGIFRFREEHIGTEADENHKGKMPTEAQFFTKLDPIFTTFNVDEARGHLYVYVDIMQPNNEKPAFGGLYRFNIADLEANPSADFWSYNPVLIDGAPVMWEGSGNVEHVGITQLAFDSNMEYLYWCYRQPTAEQIEEIEAAEGNGVKNDGGVVIKNKWAEKYDAENPLHHDAIKRIKLDDPDHKVEIVVPNVRGYGVVPVNYAGSTKPGSVNGIVAPQAELIAANNGAITALESVSLEIFDTKGTLVAVRTLAEGETFSAENLQAGVYVAVAVGANAQQVLKFAK